MNSDITQYIIIGVFCITYLMIILEEKIKINKSKPALFGGMFIYVVIAIYYATNNIDTKEFYHHIEHLMLEIVSIYFFLFVAMTYIETLIERDVFNHLKYRLSKKGYGYKGIFWATGFIAFFLSPIADNLTTALILSTLLITIQRDNKTFLVLGAINIVVASNAGGAWSPFGDITTLMVWSANKSEFTEFLYLFPSAFMGWFITAILLSIFIPKSDPFLSNNIEKVSIKKGGKFIIFLGVVTITMAIVFHHILKLPVFWGMMMGLAIINLYSSYLHKVYNEQIHIYKRMSEVHDDTLLFFFGLLSAVGGLSHMGYIDFITDFYNQFNPYTVNIIVGLLSAVIDNVPIMFAILNTDPALQQSQWLLLTLTVGIGGSLISFGSAAGIGVMGVLSGIYTFSSHLRYIWIIFIGYLVSVLVFWIQFELFI